MSLSSSANRLRARKSQVRHKINRSRLLQHETLEARQLMAYDTVVLADAPVAYYRFEETSGTTVNDSATANGTQNGVMVGGVTSVPGATAAMGNAFKLDGASGRVRITDNPVFDLGTGPATIEMWFNVSTATGGARTDLFTYKGNVGGDYGIHWQSQGAGILSDYHNGFRVTTTTNTNNAVTNGLSTGEWHHLVISRSGIGINQTVMYVDGRAVSKGQDDQTFNIANDILIGANHSNNDPGQAGTFFNGMIDEVAIYNTSLTEAQVQRHYSAGLGSYGGAVVENKPSVYYPFTSGAADASGNGLNGAVVGAVSFGSASNGGLGTAANFTGGLIQGPSASTLGMTNASWTASAWIYPRANDGDRAIFGNEINAGTDQTLHLILRGGQILMGFYADDLQTTASPPLNQWSQIVWRYDASINAQAVFLNGENVGIRIADNDYAGTNPIVLGHWGGGNAFDGLIDEAFIAPTALSPAEIAGLYRAGIQSHANSDSYSTTENANVIGNVLTNDGGPTQVATTSVTSTAGVSVTINPDGSFTYNPGTNFDYLKANEPAIDSFLYSVRNLSSDTSGRTILFANYGPGGSLNAYIYNGTSYSWDEARARAANMTLMGVSGHLATIESAAEENFIHTNYPTDFYIGLSDSTGYSVLDGVRNSQSESNNVISSAAWAWTNAAPYSYSSWFPGEPNGGATENSAQVRASDGLWNDLPSGDTLPGQTNFALPSLVEFNLGEASPGVAVPGFIVRQAQAPNGTLNNTQAAAEALLAGSNKIAEATKIYPFINLTGNGDGNIGNGKPFPLGGDREAFADVSTGAVFIPTAGDWTFDVNSDDGFELTFPSAGVTLTNTITNGNNSSPGLNGALRFEGGRGTADTLGVFNFPSAGFYPIRLVHYEGGGGDSVELTAAPGSFTGSNGNFHLVGDTANGGLVVYTSMPVAGESAKVTVAVTGQNDVPVAGSLVATPSTSDEGTTITFTIMGAADADAGETATLKYQWDINNDGTYETTTNVPTLALDKTQLAALGIDGLTEDGLPAFTAKARVFDVQNTFSNVVSTDFIVRNVAPEDLMLDGPTSAPPGASLEYLFSATDPSVLDTAAGLSFDIDWGDGNTDSFGPPETAGVNSGTVSHTFATVGTYHVVMTVTDKDGGESTLDLDVVISPVYIDVDGNLVINGTSAGDRIILTGSQGGVQARINNKFYPAMAPQGGEVRVFGFEGNDTITVSSSVSFGVYIDGGDNNDYITGGIGDDTLIGGNGSDRILGGNGNDFIYGGDGEDGPDGNDTLSGGKGEDTIYGEGGNDTINGDTEGDFLHGGDGKDTVYGGAGSDELYGDAGVDKLDGGAGNDLLTGGDDGDSLYGRDGNDVLIGGQSIDLLFGGAGSDLLLGDDITDEDAIADIYDQWKGINIGAMNAIYNQYIDDTSVDFAVDEDGSPDTLTGEAGNDWFLAYEFDKIKDFRTGDKKTVDGINI